MVPGQRGRSRVVSRGRLPELGKVGNYNFKRRLRAATRDGLGKVGRRLGALDIKLPLVRKKVGTGGKVAGWNTAERVAVGMTERECRAAEILGVKFARFALAGNPNTYGHVLTLGYGDVEVPKGIKPIINTYDYATRTYKNVGGFPVGVRTVSFTWCSSLTPYPSFGCSFKALVGLHSWAEEIKDAPGLKDLMCEQVVEDLKKAKGLYMMVVTDASRTEQGGSSQKPILDKLLKHGFKLVAKAESVHNMGAMGLVREVKNNYNVCLVVGDWQGGGDV